jgi:putative glycosyltransferase (TIGR04372 family)
MRSILRRYRGQDVLISAPNTRQYGHLGLEILMTYSAALQRRASVYFVRDRADGPLALFEIESPEVPMLRPAALDRWRFGAALRRTELADECHVAFHQWSKDARAELRDELSRWFDSPRLPRRVASHVKDTRDRLKQPFSWELPRRERIERPYYYQRRLLRHPLTIRLRDRAHEAAVRQAAAIGLREDTPIVTVHAREAGYKFGREVHDAKPTIGRDDSTRNVRIESYFAAMDYLVDRGYTVVRIGDPSMTPVRRPGVIDLATMAERTPLLELYCLLRSRLLLGSDSGPSTVAYLTNTPVVIMNCTDPIAAYPVRAHASYALKRVADRRTGRLLTLRQMLEFEYATNSRNPQLYRYYDNTPEEVVDAVREMLDVLDGRAEMTAAQVEYRELLLAAEARVRPLWNYIHKWGSDEGFIGDGRISRSFVERDL